MSSSAQPSILDSVIYGVLALALLAVGVVGVIYIMNPANAQSPFLILGPGDVFTKHKAAMIMMPLGFLGGASLAGVAVWKLRGAGGAGSAEFEGHGEEA